MFETLNTQNTLNAEIEDIKKIQRELLKMKNAVSEVEIHCKGLTVDWIGQKTGEPESIAVKTID